ncbi:MAG: hypothetical protein AABZ94_07445 [Candidatus Eisenbacteria bacterium]
MIRSLLLMLAASLALSLPAAPLLAQYIYVDVDGDSVCTANDVLPMGNDTVWVWLDTNHDATGNEVSCPTGEALTMSGYVVNLLLGSFAQGAHVSDPVNVGTWVNRMPTFTVDAGQFSYYAAGQWVRVGFSSPEPPAHVPPGRYLLGGLPIEMPHAECNVARVLSGAEVGSPERTGFTSLCAGNDGDFKMSLSVDFEGTCDVTSGCLGVKPTTWGNIKSRYR